MVLKKSIIIGLSIILGILFASASIVLATGIIAKDPLGLFFGAGTYYFNKGNYKDAVYYFSKAVAYNPDAAEAYYNMGVSEYYLGNTEEARAAFEHALKINTTYAKAEYSLGLLLYQQHDYSGAIEHLARVTELEPSGTNAHFDLAIVYVERFRTKEDSGQNIKDDLEDLRQAYSHYSTVETLHPGFPHAADNAAVITEVIKNYGS